MASPRLFRPQQLKVRARIAMLVHPQLAAGHDIERVDGILRPGQIHDAVDDEWSRLELLVVAPLEEPFHAEVLDVLRRDLIQPAEPPSVVRVGVHEPVARLLIGFQEPFVRDRKTL